LPPGVSDTEAVERLKPEGFACLPVSEFRLTAGGRTGLVLGFAGMTEELIEASIQKMAGLLRPLLQRAERA
jgi:DNA-binding transcriptional MocR family regulator